MQNTIHRLNSSHWEEIKDLFFVCENSSLERTSKKLGISVDRLSSVDNVWQLWGAAIQKYYLGSSDHHHLYGNFVDEKMQTMLGWRSGLPAPYENDWVIVYMKSRPSETSNLSQLEPLWRLMFDHCEAQDLDRWHAIVKKDRYTKFDAFERRYTPDIHQRYKYLTTIDIPAHTRPSVEWVWAMMGRSLLPSHQEVRTGTRIE